MGYIGTQKNSIVLLKKKMKMFLFSEDLYMNASLLLLQCS